MKKGPEPPLSSAAAADVDTVARGGGVQILGQVSARTLTFAFTAVFVRILNEAAYGVYRSVTQVLSIAAQLGLAGFNYAAMRFITRARATRDHAAVRGTARVALTTVGIASCVVALAILVGADLLAGAFADNAADENDFVRYFRIGAAYIPLFALLQVLRYCTQAYKTMVPSVMAGNIVQPITRFLFGWAFLALGFEIAGAVVTLTMSTAAGVLVAAVYFRRMLTAEERAAVPAAQLVPMVKFALPQAGASMLGVQVLGLGIIILGLVSTDVQTGLFALALSLQGPGNVFLGGIVNIWAPVVSDLHAKGDVERLGRLYQTINRWIATFSFPVFAALLIIPDFFVWMVAGSKAEGAADIVAILAIGNIFYTGTGPTGYVISMTGRPGVNFANSVVAVGLYVVLGAAIVPDHGAVGMAIVDTCVTALVNVARVIEARILVGVQPFGRSFAKPVLATLVGAALLFVWDAVLGPSRLAQGAGLVVAAAVYLWVLKLLGLDPEERHVLDRIKERLSSLRRPRARH